MDSSENSLHKDVRPAEVVHAGEEIYKVVEVIFNFIESFHCLKQGCILLSFI